MDPETTPGSLCLEVTEGKSNTPMVIKATKLELKPAHIMLSLYVFFKILQGLYLVL